MTLLHRRADLRETMSDYLVRELERYGVAVRDRSEVAALHGDEGQLEAVTLKSGERLPLSFLFCFLGALPRSEWLDDIVARDDNGFILTGAAAGADTILETSLPGVFAAGDVRSGSTKRCATGSCASAMAKYHPGHPACAAGLRSLACAILYPFAMRSPLGSADFVHAGRGAHQSPLSPRIVQPAQGS